MAKTGIGEHTKTIALAVELDIPECFAVGVLECFWQFVAREAPDGDVTAHKPALVARRIRYPGSGESLFAALLAAGFLDLTEDGRTVVHDWSEHANDSVHTMLYRAIRPFCDGVKPKPGKVGKDEKVRLDRQWGELAVAPAGHPGDDSRVPDRHPEDPAGSPDGADSGPAGPQRVPAGVPTLPSPTLPSPAIPSGPAVPPDDGESTIFEKVKKTLTLVAEALKSPLPTDEKIREWLPARRKLAPLVREIGPERAAAVFVWCAEHFPGGKPWGLISDNLAVFETQMRDGVAFVPRSVSSSGSPPGKQSLMEQMREAAGE